MEMANLWDKISVTVFWTRVSRGRWDNLVESQADATAECPGRCLEGGMSLGKVQDRQYNS